MENVLPRFFDSTYQIKIAPEFIRSYRYLLYGSFVFGEMPIRESEPTLNGNSSYEPKDHNLLCSYLS